MRYDYECSNCGIFEVRQRITEPALTQCPTCESRISRVLSAPEILFKAQFPGKYIKRQEENARVEAKARELKPH